MKDYDVLVIGGGPAGIGTAIQTIRYGYNVEIIEKNEIGGLLRNANLIENFAGFPKGINGNKLTSLFKKQIKHLNIPILYETALEIEFEDKFIIKTNKNIYSSYFLVLAAGTKAIIPQKPDLSNLPTDSYFFELTQLKNPINRKIAIIGGGDAAFDYALQLSEKNKINIINRSEKYKGLDLLFDRIQQDSKIIYKNQSIVEKVVYYDKKIRLFCSRKNDNFEIDCDLLGITIGREPNYIKVSENVKAQKDNRYFEIGDLVNGIRRQASIAYGNGIDVAMKIHEIKKNESISKIR